MLLQLVLAEPTLKLMMRPCGVSPYRLWLGSLIPIITILRPQASRYPVDAVLPLFHPSLL